MNRIETLQPRGRDDIHDWTEHWAAGNQASFSQKFFSFYRKVVFARTVAYFFDRYFPPMGVFVEAGCGTSETSWRIDKRQGGRILVAVDIIPAILLHTHPVMDASVSGDIFGLPFGENSIDGLWNVGVMEHFLHPQIDRILAEFHRVLKPGAPLLLLWPGKYSLPQRMLRLVEAAINLRKRDNGYHFHPSEISQLASRREGAQVLSRNGFEVLAMDPGWRSGMAFITLVGQRKFYR